MNRDVPYPTRSYPYRPLAPGAAGAAPQPQDTPIAALPPALKARLVGVDQRSGRDLKPEELARLSDPMAELVLKRGRFPTTLQELLRDLDAPPAAIPVQTVFIVSEWGQIPLADAGPQIRRQLRYVVARGKQGVAGADLLISTAPPSDNPDIFLQVAAWDPVNEVFHYYERSEGGATWFWEGDSWHALSAPTRGQGPFDSHVNGAPVMKELKEPWLHWNSVTQEIPRENFSAQHPINLPTEAAFFQRRESAHILQKQIVEPSVRRWTDARFRRVFEPPAGIADPPALMRQVLTATSVNIASAKQRSRSTEPVIRVPSTMFADTDTLVDILLADITTPPVAIDRPLYEQAIAAMRLSLRDTRQDFTRAGDAFFAWPVPERAFEDIVVVDALLRNNILSAHFVTALLMIDFSNPIDSARRAALMRHVPADPTPPKGPGGLEHKMLQSIAATAANADISDEAEIMRFMQLADGAWQADAGQRISALFDAVRTRATTPAGVLDYLRLADWRRRSFRRKRRLAEFDLTLPFSSVSDDAKSVALTPHGRVV
jgi:hypothetical protein